MDVNHEPAFHSLVILQRAPGLSFRQSKVVFITRTLALSFCKTQGGVLRVGELLKVKEGICCVDGDVPDSLAPGHLLNVVKMIVDQYGEFYACM